MAALDPSTFRDTLQNFLTVYHDYIALEDLGHDVYQLQSHAQWLHRNSTLVANIVTNLVDDRRTRYCITQSDILIFHDTLALALNPILKQRHDIVCAHQHVIRVVNEAIGNIDNDTIPSKVIHPILPMNDPTLSQRCTDLLQAPGSFDRVINQATQVLEARLRDRLPYDKLCELIPQAKEQVGESLANHLLNPKNPVIVVSDKHLQQRAFHKIVVGIMAFLRNPSHHQLDDETEWVLAWSVVGIVDSLLAQLDNAYVPTDTNINNPHTEHQ